ncbi:MAG: CYTH domain-containing protein [Gammaproteobacteria bacterium]|nr:CYTH domain-containing protein [Gammaproteobacteria bacterium]
MATEIERKFLVLNDDWRKLATRQKILKQGYFAGGGKASIRIRVVDESANINIKSATLDVARKEYEFPVPYADAREMLEQLCEKPLIEKTRYYVPYGNHIWEVDEFTGDNAGLVVAEIELLEMNESFEKPPWLGEEVSHDTRYYNVCLVKHPYKDW